MALKSFDGFDSYDSLDQLVRRRGFTQWTYVNPDIFIIPQLVPGAFGGQKLSMNPAPNGLVGEGPTLRAAFSTGSFHAGFMGFRLSLKTGSVFLRFYDSQNNRDYFTVSLHAAGAYVGTTIGNSPNNAFTTDGDMFVEIGWVAQISEGRIVVRINNVVVFDKLGCTATDAPEIAPGTPGASSLYGFNALEIKRESQTGGTLDDFYVCDTVVDPNAIGTDNFLGDRRSVVLEPTADGETPQQWGAVGAESWRNLVRADDDATYNTTVTNGAFDLFTLSVPIATITNIIAVQVVGSYRKTDASAGSMKQLIQSGATQVASPPHSNIGNAYSFYTDIFTLDPATNAAWTVAALAPSNLKIGYQLTV